MNFLLEITKDDYTTPIITTKGFSETLLFGLQMVLIGMATVFAVLILLWIALTLFKVFFHDIAKTKKESKTENTPTPVAAPLVNSTSDEEIVAVIAAAIAMAESESNGIKFRVVSFNRK